MPYGSDRRLAFDWRQLGASVLRIYLVGRVMVESSEGVFDASVFPGRQGRLAFVYLAAAPRRVERDELAHVIWPDQLPAAWDAAVSALVSKLRRGLAAAGLRAPFGVESAYGSYALRLPEGAWLDLRAAVNALDRAEGALRGGDPRTAWSHAAVASAVLQRPFLSGERGAWVDDMRRRMRDRQIRAFDTLAGAWLGVGDPRAAVAAARRAVDLGPYRESSHARLMEAQLAAGDRAEALRTYEDLRARLAETLGVAPAVAVQQLYRRALDEDGPAPVRNASAG